MNAEAGTGALALAILAAAIAGQKAGAPAPAAPQPAPPAEMKAYVETIPGTSVTFEMVPIAGGRYLQGSPPGERGRSEDEGPQREVTVRPFWMATTEVTWDQYDPFAFARKVPRPGAAPIEPAARAAADAVTRPTPPYADESFGYGKGRQPALSLPHHAAMEYSRWVSALTGKTYRLPTEAEWEYACRAGSATAYSFGDDPARLGEHAWFYDNSDGRPQPVGTRKANAWGLFDMHANLAEWVLDHYQKDAYTRQPGPVTAPVVKPTDRRYPHVVRGGSWDHEADRVRCAARQASGPEWNRRDPQRPQSIWWLTDATFVGFRLVRPLEEQPELAGLQSSVTRESPDR